MKYIDADKLIKSVNNYQEGAKAALNPTDGDADYYKGKIDACKDIQEFINSHQQEQQEVNIEKEIEEHVEDMPMSEFTHESEVDIHYDWARKEFRYFYELGQREMRHRITNPEYNAKVIERLKSEQPTIKEE